MKIKKIFDDIRDIVLFPYHSIGQNVQYVNLSFEFFKE